MYFSDSLKNHRLGSPAAGLNGSFRTFHSAQSLGFSMSGIARGARGGEIMTIHESSSSAAGASARERLKAAAAKAWGVDRADVVARQGKLTAGDHIADYATFATAAAEITLAVEPAIKTPEQWWLFGKPTPRLDVPVKVNGSAQYCIDTRLPDMAYAAVKCIRWDGAWCRKDISDKALLTGY